MQLQQGPSVFYDKYHSENDVIQSVVLSPDGKRIVVQRHNQDSPGLLDVIDIETRTNVCTLEINEIDPFLVPVW